MTNIPNYYDVLGITTLASTETVRTAYKTNALKWHPDKHPEEGREKAEKMFKLVSEAYQVLGNWTIRCKYDNGEGVWKARAKKNIVNRERHAELRNFTFDDFEFNDTGTFVTPVDELGVIGFDFDDPYDVFEEYFYGYNNEEEDYYYGEEGEEVEVEEELEEGEEAVVVEEEPKAAVPPVQENMAKVIKSDMETFDEDLASLNGSGGGIPPPKRFRNSTISLNSLKNKLLDSKKQVRWKSTSGSLTNLLATFSESFSEGDIAVPDV